MRLVSQPKYPCFSPNFKLQYIRTPAVIVLIILQVTLASFFILIKTPNTRRHDLGNTNLMKLHNLTCCHKWLKMKFTLQAFRLAGSGQNTKGLPTGIIWKNKTKLTNDL